MNTERWQRIQQLFEESLARDPAERDAFLATACGDDAELLAELRSLLSHDASDGPDLDEVVRGQADEMLADFSHQRVGAAYGPWELVTHLADGGMGAVYLARRCDGAFEQQVAVKLLNPALVGAQGRQRLESERQILANLNHPNIAHLVDGGTGPDGVPFLVMDYVEGLPIDAYCNENSLDTRQRLALFIKVCAAVDYAHRNLVVHRDIKPSNILVDANREPQLLDFGISKLLDDTDPGLTQAEQRLFTPAHASPEQITGSTITTATDVYALGVLLYELLAGRLPYAADDKTAYSSALIAQRILETEPLSPSAAVTRGSSERIEAGQRRGAQLSPERLKRELRGDLDNIVLMAMRKEPERRYGSARALMLDVERYLDDRPVLARPSSLGYRAAKLLKRRRGAVISAVMVSLLVLGLTVFAFRQIIAERDAAAAAKVRAENAVAFLEDLLKGADRFASVGREVTVEDILEIGAQRIESELVEQPIEQARLMHTIAGTYVSLSSNEAALPLARRALALRQSALGPTHVETLESMRTLGTVISNNGDPVAAREILEETMQLQRQHLGADSPELAATLQELGVVLRVLGNPGLSLEYQREAFDILSSLPPTHDQYRYQPYVMNQIGNALDSMGDYEGAIAAFQRTLELLDVTGQQEDPVRGAALHNLGLALRASGRVAEALPYFQRALEHTRRTLGEQSIDFEAQASSLGRTHGQLGNFEEAQEYSELALRTAETLYGTGHQYYAYNLVNLARLRQLEGKHADALVLLEQATGIYRATFGPYHRFLAAAEVGQAESMIEVGQVDDARALISAVLTRIQADPEHERHVEAVARSVKGRALGLLGEDAEAEQLLTASLGDLRQSLGDEHQLTQAAARRLGQFVDVQREQSSPPAPAQ
ncbi:MAG: serine/threonine-protein kinase [Halieaceae bacterium]|jgi:serine/threonine-protein kinase|nr:serine/threonine-protein kinase [Halieaceae bacterium]